MGNASCEWKMKLLQTEMELIAYFTLIWLLLSAIDQTKLKKMIFHNKRWRKKSSWDEERRIFSISTDSHNSALASFDKSAQVRIYGLL